MEGMGRSLLALLAVLAACGDRYGAYFTVDGHDTIEFDRVELYFGEKDGDEVPVPPGHMSIEPEPGLLFRRQAADSDNVMLAAPASSYTYFVPPGEANDRLGDYVLAIAYRGNDPVGIGELFGFEVPTDEVVFTYQIPLVGYANEAIERWGRPAPDCIRWKRDRGDGPTIVAMARGNDADCDAFVDRDDPAGDCEPLRYCDGSRGPGCVSDSACVALDGNDGNGCRIGTCQNKDGQTSACSPTTCAVDAVCTACDLDASPRELLECVLLANGTHLDYPITVKPSQALCSEPYKVFVRLPTIVPCLNPKIEAAVDWMPSEPFHYQIDPGPGSTCLLTIMPEMPESSFVGVPHIMVSVDSAGGPMGRQTFIFGLSTVVEACGGDETIDIDPATVSCLP
jgi:hypothetical protein